MQILIKNRTYTSSDGRTSSKSIIGKNENSSRICSSKTRYTIVNKIAVNTTVISWKHAVIDKYFAQRPFVIVV